MTSPTGSGLEGLFEPSSADFARLGGIPKCTLCRAPCEVRSCVGKNFVMLRNFLAGMNVFKTVGEIEAAINGMPFMFCLDCRDTLMMMSEKFERYVRAKDDFEAVRNALAVVTIKSAAAIPPTDIGNGTQERIRQLICERWNPLNKGVVPNVPLNQSRPDLMTLQPKSTFTESDQ